VASLTAAEHQVGVVGEIGISARHRVAGLVHFIQKFVAGHGAVSLFGVSVQCGAVRCGAVSLELRLIA
jgi:hypothetical protein